MAKKLRLAVEELTVESFRTDAEGLGERGTVQGRSVADPHGPTESSCEVNECGCIPTALTCDPWICWGTDNVNGTC